MELLVVPSSPEGHDRKEEPRKKEIGKAGIRIGAPARAGPEPHCSCGTSAYLLETPRAIFFTFFFFSPRAPVRLALGATFFRAARFSFFRSSLSSILVVSATWFLSRSNLFLVSRKLADVSLRITGFVSRRKRRERVITRTGTDSGVQWI